MNVPLVLSAPILLRSLLGIVMLAVAAACFFGGARGAMRRAAENKSTTTQRVTASYSKRLEKASWRDRILAATGWSLLAFAFALRGLGSLLFAHAVHLPEIFFAFVSVAAPVSVAVGLFLLLSPQGMVEHEAAEENEYSNGRLPAQTAENAKPGLLSLHGSLLAHFLGKLSGRARSLGLLVFDSLLLGSSAAALSWWLSAEPRVVAGGATTMKMGGVHSLALVLWFSSAAWIALNGLSLRRARLQRGRFQSSFEQFLAGNSAYPGNLVEAQQRWNEAVLRPIWLALLGGVSCFGWAAMKAEGGVQPANEETILLLCGSLGFAAAAWMTHVFQASSSGASSQANTMANTEARLRDLVLRIFLRRFRRAEEKRNGTLSSTRTFFRKPAEQAPEEPASAHLNANANANAGAAERSAAVEEDITPAGALQKNPELLHSAFQVTRNFLTLFLPCAAAAAGIWHVMQWKSPTSIAAVEVEPEIWISEILVSFASLRYLLLSLHQNLYVSRTAQSLRVSVETLREEVSWRTQQLTTLHSVSADLNNTLNNEQVLNIALQRLMDAVRAEAGAVWLVADFDQVVADKTNQARSFGHWNAELRRHRNPHVSGGASSTRTSVATRFSLADACDSAQMGSTSKNREDVAADEVARDNEAANAVRSNARRSRLFPNGSRSGNGNNDSAIQEPEKENSSDLEASPEEATGNDLCPGEPEDKPEKRWNMKVFNEGEPDGVLRRASHAPDTCAPSSRKSRHWPQSQSNGSAPSGENAAPQNGVLDGSVPPHQNWRLVRAAGYDTPTTNRSLEAMSRALEAGGIARCARLAASWYGTIGDVHLAPIRWNGEVVGVLSVTSRRRDFGGAERRLLEALAIEVSGALRNAHMYQQARRWAERDGVTNLFNHRAMQEKLGQEMLRAQQTGTELTVVMMDLDNFKFFNDTYGHPVGDGVLVTVAQCLRDCCRNTDILGRYGGDEFIVLLPGSNVQDALNICRRIEESIEKESYGEGGNEERRIPIGLSFGAAVYPQDGRTPLEILSVADANLYDAKRGGSPLAQINKNEDALELRHLKENGVGGSFGVLDALVTAIDHKDHYTRRHSEDVTHWAVLMGRELGFSEETLRAVRISGLLHDVGKIAVPDAILRKPGRLSDDEFNILQQHPVFGALIVKDVPNLPEVLGGIRHHHERFDGKGYPDKLAGEEIPMLGRLLAVPDCFSAMTTNRPYRKALEWSEALAEIERGSGTQFDPQMAEAFLEVIARLIAEQDNPTPLPHLNGNNARNAVYETIDYPSAYAS